MVNYRRWLHVVGVSPPQEVDKILPTIGARGSIFQHNPGSRPLNDRFYLLWWLGLRWWGQR